MSQDWKQILQNIVWWPGVVMQAGYIQIAVAAGATYYLVGVPSLDNGIMGVAYPWLGFGAALTAANAVMGSQAAPIY